MSTARIRKLPTLADLQREKRATPKPAPRVIRRQERKADLAAKEDAFRKAVWDRDQGKSRASGKPVVHAHLDPAKRGDVAHLVARSRSSALRYQRSNGVLLTAEEHSLSDARTAPGGTVWLEIVGIDADADLTFIRRDADGRELWRRTSSGAAR